MAVAVHPGLVQTSLAAGWMSGSDLAHGFLQSLTAALLGALRTFILEPPSRAARTLLYAALAPAAEVTVPSGRSDMENTHCVGVENTGVGFHAGLVVMCALPRAAHRATAL